MGWGGSEVSGGVWCLLVGLCLIWECLVSAVLALCELGGPGVCWEGLVSAGRAWCLLGGPGVKSAISINQDYFRIRIRFIRHVCYTNTEFTVAGRCKTFNI